MSVPRSFIKNIAIEIDSSYEFDNSPITIESHNKDELIKSLTKQINRRRKFLKSLNDFLEKSCKKSEAATNIIRIPFIGRGQHVAKFLKFLESSTSSGVFLVTGYRGMGKTSFVNHVLDEYKERNFTKACNENSNYGALLQLKKRREFLRECYKIKTINLTLAQNNPQEIDILKLMVMSVYDEFKGHLKNLNETTVDKYRKKLFKLQNWLLLFIITAIPFSILFWKVKDLNLNDIDYGASLWLVSLGTLVAFLYTTRLIFFKLRIYKLQHKDCAYNRINWLVERINSTLGEENAATETNVPFINIKLFNSEKRTKQYALANTKEIEYELQKFLQKAKKDHLLEFVFVFDELDKVDPAIPTSYEYQNLEGSETQKTKNAYGRDIRDRKRAIINIITGLKNFFTTADARFIFIAGREMFDASLADIADRQSPISSIFTYVFNIESLLKETALNNSDNDKVYPSISHSIETFLKLLLFGKELCDFDENDFDLYQLITGRKKNLSPTYHNDLSEEEKGKLYFMIQNFITYLTYRTNGSPKKLIKEIHEFIIVDNNKDHDGRNKEQTIFLNRCHKNNKEKKLYLYFNYYDQYRIGFINYLYRPFLIKHGRSFKLYSDNILVATSYLFDHLLKFHPFAFSISNLELVPELLSSNKTPSLRVHIQQIIDHLSVNHIREITIGLFDFKFYSRTLNELTFLSKISEKEAAALNYTLDENYFIKLHVTNKIKELRNSYAGFSNGENDNNQIFSIAHLNETLGDLYFFDQEYDDAIGAYSDTIRPLTNELISKMNTQDFIVLIRNKLKAGLCFEKVNSYDDALAHYSDGIHIATRFLSYRLTREKHIKIVNDSYTFPRPIKSDDQFNDGVYHSSAFSDLLQIILQCFLSQLFIQEKKSVAGISEFKLFIALGSFFKLTKGFLLENSRNHVVKAYAFLHAGNLMYFRNNDLPMLKNDEYKKAYKDILPVELYNELEKLGTKYDCILSTKTGRRPVLSLYLYILGLAEIMKYGDKSKNNIECSPLNLERNKSIDTVDEIKKSNNIIFYLLKHFEDEAIVLDDKELRGIYYNTVATFLSNIGDCLLGIDPQNLLSDNNDYTQVSLDIWIANNGSHKEGKILAKIYDPPSSKSNVCKENSKNISITDLFSPDSLKSVDEGNSNFLNYLKETDPCRLTMPDILRCYYLSALYFLKQGRTFSSSFQYRKILYLLRLVLYDEPGKAKLNCDFLTMLEKTVLKPILKITTQNSFNTDSHMLNKAAELKINYSYSLNNISNHPESREAILLFNYIRIKLGRLPRCTNDENILALVSPANSFATQHSRLMELDFYAKYLRDMVVIELRNYKGPYSKADEERLTQSGTSYLYTMLLIIQILDIYGLDYRLGHSYFAYTHFNIGNYLHKLKNHESIKEKIEARLKSLIGTGSFASLDAMYHFGKAKRLYENAIQLHTAGDSYKNIIDEMIYLEDDFNDNAYHFGAALDRYLMANGSFQRKINLCNFFLNKGEQFKQENFFR